MKSNKIINGVQMRNFRKKALLKDLKLVYNKARQEAITSELSEIVSGAAALG